MKIVLPTSAGVEPVTSWSPVGQRNQLSQIPVSTNEVCFGAKINNNKLSLQLSPCRELCTCGLAYLIIISSKADALHGTRVVISGMVKFTHWHMTMYLVENWWKATTEGNYLVTMLVKPDTHTALLYIPTTIPQYATVK